MAIQEVIKYEGDNKTLIYKHPAEDFNTLSHLIVHESQEAVLFSDGQALDLFGAGDHVLETKNIPLLSKLRNLVTGGVSPFHVEVYFINLATMLDIIWGTPSQVTVQDPVYRYSYNAGANGSFGLKVVDSRKLLINLVGTEQNLTIEHIQKYFKDLITTRVKNYIAVELGRYSYNTINQQLDEISEGVSARIKEDIASYGIDILNFFVSSVVIKPEDLEELKNLDNNIARKRYEALGDKESKVIHAEAEAQSRSIQGYTWAQEQQADISRTFAGNEGFAANPANMMAQMPVAFSLGEMMRDNVEKTSQNSRNLCRHCGKEIAVDAKFCQYCGEKIEREMFCTKCGAKIAPDARFCSNCGEKTGGVD